MKTKTTILLLSIACFVGISGYSGENRKIRPGVSLGTVLHHLGEPNARIETKGSARYYYDRGEIRLEDDVVTHVSLMSEEAAEAKKAEAAKKRELNTERGIEVRHNILADEEFAELPASDREAFWTEFRDRYPDVNVEAEYEKARLAARREAEKKREEDRLANLEARVKVAEERSRRAEQAAAERAWPDRSARTPRVNSAHEGIYIRYNTGRRIYYPHSSYLPIVISTDARPGHSGHSNWNRPHPDKTYKSNLWNSHSREETYIYGRGGNTSLNLGRTRW